MPYKKHPELAKGHAVIILTDDAGSLRDEEQRAWLEEHIGQPRGFFLGAASLFLEIDCGRGEREREHHHQLAGAERLRARQLAHAVAVTDGARALAISGPWDLQEK